METKYVIYLEHKKNKNIYGYLAKRPDEYYLLEDYWDDEIIDFFESSQEAIDFSNNYKEWLYKATKYEIPGKISDYKIEIISLEITKKSIIVLEDIGKN